MTERRHSETTRRAGLAAVGILTAATAALAFASCFNPNIPSNSFRCNLTDPEPVCPAGQECESGWCVNPGDKPATDGGGIPGTDTGIDSGPLPLDSGDLDGGITCGDGIIEGTEECDLANLGVATCASEGFVGGTLSCSGTCTFDTGACNNCGNNLIDAGEPCDGTDIGTQSCVMMGFASGTLTCNPNCEGFNTSACVPLPGCNDGTIDPGEDCELGPPLDLNGEDCDTATMSMFTMGTLGCTAACLFDLSGCSECGDDSADGAEVCDGTDLASETCATQMFVSGTLACAGTCMAFDTSGCSNCGNGTADAGEDCDGADLGTGTCVSEGFMGGGTLSCTAGCTYNTGMCDDCSMDMHCGGGTPACDLGTNTCELCYMTSTTACGAMETCTALNECDCGASPSNPAGEACTGTRNPTCLGTDCGCDTDSTCGAMETCTAGACVCGGAMPAMGEACPGTQNPTCVGGTACGCDADSTCGAMEVCTAGSCECGGPGPALGEACVGTSNPICLGSACGCDADSTCDTDETCAAGACTCGTTAPTMGLACGLGMTGVAACIPTAPTDLCDCDGAGPNPPCAAGETCDSMNVCI